MHDNAGRFGLFLPEMARFGGVRERFKLSPAQIGNCMTLDM
jgi:hypothetical protein